MIFMVMQRAVKGGEGNRNIQKEKLCAEQYKLQNGNGAGQWLLCVGWKEL